MSIDTMFLRSVDRIDIPRHPRWGGPMILPPGGGKPVYYSRISSFAKTLEDASGLNLWFGRMTALGLAQRRDLVSLTATTQPDDKNALNKIVEAAMAAAKSDAAANRGTALHAATEHVDLGGEVEAIDTDMRADIEAYMEATKKLRVLAIEKFVVLDDFKLGGTFDRLVMLPDGRVVVADVKSGKDADKYAQSTAMQIALYAHGQMYDPSGVRTPMPGVDLTTGLLIHLPAGTGTCRLYELDLTRAWQMAQLASHVKDWRKAKVASPVSF